MEKKNLRAIRYYCRVLYLLLKFRPCLPGGRVTLASGLTLAGGQKIARV